MEELVEYQYGTFNVISRQRIIVSLLCQAMNFTADEFLRHTKLPCLDEAGSCHKVIDDVSFRNRRDVL